MMEQELMNARIADIRRLSAGSAARLARVAPKRTLRLRRAR